MYNGQKSSAEGIDLELEKENRKYIVSIKSGPNWGNSGQILQMRTNFRKAKEFLEFTRRLKILWPSMAVAMGEIISQRKEII